VGQPLLPRRAQSIDLCFGGRLAELRHCAVPEGHGLHMRLNQPKPWKVPHAKRHTVGQFRCSATGEVYRAHFKQSITHAHDLHSSLRHLRSSCVVGSRGPPITRRRRSLHVASAAAASPLAQFVKQRQNILEHSQNVRLHQGWLRFLYRPCLPACLPASSRRPDALAAGGATGACSHRMHACACTGQLLNWH
jgi:hypothetical protein